ncbi:hypothetical protein HDU99_008192 [Rhizoclosmatium hyalinum]|nr:hypothetical protein HDU99_008192 [Rhizoclosmatium hyalinum]
MTSLPDIRITLASTDAHITQIKTLHNANLRRLLPVEVQERDGFVTAEYEVEYLAHIHKSTPAVVALAQVDGAEKVVGYVLAATKTDSMSHNLLKDLVHFVDSNSSYNGKPLASTNYIVVGQLCVAKEFRGAALAKRMYQHYAEVYLKSGKFECAVTDVVSTNVISLRAHEKAGWVIVDSLSFEGVDFKVIVLPA